MQQLSGSGGRSRLRAVLFRPRMRAEGPARGVEKDIGGIDVCDVEVEEEGGEEADGVEVEEAAG